jgi:NADH:ubiquinone oxidoreductase subunit 6 (subunit J)
MDVPAILFYFLAAMLIFFSLKVVTTKNLFHSVMSAFAVLMSVAGIFFLLNAEFLGIVQILVYAGAVSILVLFVVMLTTAGTGYEIDWEKTPSIWSWLVTFLFFGGLGFTILSIDWPEVAHEPLQSVTNGLAERIFTEYLLPFEIASILILATLIGSIVLARRD